MSEDNDRVKAAVVPSSEANAQKQSPGPSDNVPHARSEAQSHIKPKQQLRHSKRRRKRPRQYDESSSNDEEEKGNTKDAMSTVVKSKTRTKKGATRQQQKVPSPSMDVDVQEYDEDTEITTSLETRARNHAVTKLERFDVSTLLPLTRNSKSIGKAKTRIELICKLTGIVHVVFPSVDYAAQALGKTRKEVRRACRAFTSSPIDEETDLAFPTCQLRHVLESSAYEFGAHSRDFALCDETHDERVERWAKLKETTDSYLLQKGKIRSSIGMDGLGTENDDLQTSSSSQVSVANTSSKPRSSSKPKSDDRSDRKKRKHERMELRGARNCNLSLLDGSTIWEQPVPAEDDESEKESRGNSNTDQQVILSLCVACQSKQAGVVLKPCHHCVLCRDCAVRWCPNFCPKCNTKIHDRLLPEQGILFVQPSFLSGFSFY